MFPQRGSKGPRVTLEAFCFLVALDARGGRVSLGGGGNGLVGVRAATGTALPSGGVPAVTSLWRDLSVRARVAAALAGAVVVLAVPAALIGPVVRAKVSSKAATRGLVVDVGRVRPSWDGFWLLDVAVRSRAGRVAGTLNAVHVPFGERAVAVHGGRLVLRGTPDELEREVASKAEVKGGGGRRLVTLDGVAVALLDAHSRGSRLDAWGVGGAREARGDSGSVAYLVQVTVRGGNWTMRGVEVALGTPGPGRLRTVRIAEAEFWVLISGRYERRLGLGATGATTAPPVEATKIGSRARAAGRGRAREAGVALREPASRLSRLALRPLTGVSTWGLGRAASACGARTIRSRSRSRRAKGRAGGRRRSHCAGSSRWLVAAGLRSSSRGTGEPGRRSECAMGSSGSRTRVKRRQGAPQTGARGRCGARGGNRRIGERLVSAARGERARGARAQGRVSGERRAVTDGSRVHLSDSEVWLGET